MKALTPYTPNNPSAMSGNLSQWYVPNNLQSDYSFQARINQTAEGRHPAYVVGELANRAYNAASSWVSRVYHSLPDIGFPGVAAKIPEAIDPSDKALLDKALGYTKVVGAKNDAQKQEVLELFQEAFLKAIEGETVTKDSIALWLNDGIWGNKQSIELYLTFTIGVDLKATEEKTSGGYNPASNRVILSTFKGVDELAKDIRHEIGGHAADTKRYTIAVDAKVNPRKYQPGRSSQHYMKDSDAKLSENLILGCQTNVTELSLKVQNCVIDKGDGCNDEMVKWIEASYPLRISFIYDRSPGFIFEDGEFFTKNNMKFQLFDVDKQQYKIVVHGNSAAFIYIWEGIKGVIELYDPNARIYETSAYLTEALPDGFKQKKICPALYEFEVRQNEEAKRFVQRLEQQKTRSGGRNEL